MTGTRHWTGDAYVFDECVDCGENSALWCAHEKDIDTLQQPRFGIRVVFGATSKTLKSGRSRHHHVELCLLQDQGRLPLHENIIRIWAHFFDDPIRLGLSGSLHESPAANGLPIGVGSCIGCVDRCLFTVTELVNTTLFSLARDRRRSEARPKFLSESEISVLVEQVSLALEHLKRHRVAHRDLRPECMLIAGSLEHGTPGTVKLKDFGKFWDADKPDWLCSSGSCLDRLVAHYSRHAAGRDDHNHISLVLAPDALGALRRGEGVDFYANDVWALGRAVYWAAAGPECDPFPGADGDAGLFEARRYQGLPAAYAFGARRLVRRLLEPDLGLRLRAEEAGEYAREVRREASGVRPLTALAGTGSGRAAEAFAGLGATAPPALFGTALDKLASSGELTEAASVPPLAALLSTGGESERIGAARTLCRFAAVGAREAHEVAAAGCIPQLVAMASAASREGQRTAAEALAALACGNEGHQVAIAEAGGIPAFLKLAGQAGDDELQRPALAALRGLCGHGQLQAEVLERGGAALVVGLLGSLGEASREEAVAALKALAGTSEGRARITAARAIPGLVEIASSGSLQGRALAAGVLQRLASGDADRQAEIISCGGVQPLVCLLARGDTQVHAQASATLESLVAGRPELALSVVEAGGVEPLVRSLAHGDRGTQVSAVRALHSMTACPKSLAAVGAFCGPSPFVSLLETGSTSVKEQAAGALSRLATDGGHRKGMVAAGAIPHLVKLIKANAGAEPPAAHAAAVLGSLALDASNESVLVEAGVIPALLRLVRQGQGPARSNAVDALANLARHGGETRASVKAQGGIHPLVLLATNGGAGDREGAAGALRNLAFDDQCRHAIVQAGGIPAFVKLLLTGTEKAKERAAGALRNLSMAAHCEDVLNAALLDAGALPALVATLAPSESTAAREQATATLRNLAFCARNKALIASEGAVPALTGLLADPHAVTRANAAGALANLANGGDGEEGLGAAVAQAGAVPALVALLRDGSSAAAQERAAAALGNLSFVGRGALHGLIVEAGAVEALIALSATTGNRTAQERSVSVLRNLAGGGAGAKAAVVGAGGLPHLIALLSSSALGVVVKEHAAATLWSLTHDAAHRAEIAEEGGITALVDVLADGPPAAQEHAAAAMWNFTCGTCRDEIAIISAGGVAALIRLLAEGTGDASMHAAGALANLAGGSTQAKAAILDAGGLPALRALRFSAASWAAEGDGPAARERAARALVCARERAGEALRLLGAPS